MKKAITNISVSVLFILLIATLIISPSWVQALEIVRQKNVETVIVFPIQGTGGDSETGLAGMDTESDYWNDGANPDGFVDSTEPVEIGATGIYYIPLSQAEMNYDYIAIQVISGSEDTFIPAQFILIRTTIGDPLNYAVTDDGGAINVTGGAVDTVTTVSNIVSANITQVGGDAIQDNNDGRLEVNVEEIADAAINVATAQIGVNIVQVGADAIVDNGDGRLEVNVEEIGDSAINETVAGHLDVNVTYWEDSAVSDSDGVPDVNVEEWDADAVPAAADGLPEVNVVEVGDSDISETVAGHLDVNTTYWEDSAITDGDGVPDVNTIEWDDAAITDADDDPDVDVVSMGANVITSASINDGAISDVDVDDDVMVDVKTIKTVDAVDALDTAANTVTVTAFAANVINDAAIDPDVDALVKDEVLNVMTVDTFTEPGQEAPPAEPTIEEMIHYLYKYFRNKIVTDAATIELYNDAGAVVDQQWSIDDDGADFTRGEAETGP
jgi:hypothetical protein